MTLANPQAFFDHLRGGPYLGPSLSQSEIDGCNTILTACEGWSPAWTAYALATGYHETAHTMQPVHEMGGPNYLRRMYDIEGLRPAKAREIGNLSPGDGVKYAGRGLVQITGKSNYARADRELGVDLIDTPELALRPDIAARVMARGMAEGWFTGKRLSDYLPGPTANRTGFCDARRIINGQDRAEDIADYAGHFQDALSDGGWHVG